MLAAPVLRSDAVADDIANFGSDVNSVPFRRQRFTEDLFAAAVAVNISRIEKIDAQFARTSHRGNGIALRGLAPSPLCTSGFAGAADRPATKSDFADFESGLSEDAIVHDAVLSFQFCQFSVARGQFSVVNFHPTFGPFLLATGHQALGTDLPSLLF